MHTLRHFHVRLRPHHIFFAEMMLSLFFSVMVFVPLTSAADVVRFQHRSLLMNKAEPGQISRYTLSFQYTTETAIGSVDMLFCISPIPDDPCRPPVGLDVSGADLVAQLGETGYEVEVLAPNHLLLKRVTPEVVSAIQSTYIFDGMKNPTDRLRPFSIRLSDYATTDGVGPVIDLGSVVGSVSDGIMLYTQVPPLLLFCVGQQVSDDCSDIQGGNYTDMGTLDSEGTITAQSQMAAGTNATAGYTITVNGTTMLAGNKIIDAITVPTASTPGTNQFGINLVANTVPTVGGDPDGDFTNAVAAAAYSQPNKYLFNTGDVVASAPNVSLVRRFTVSYIVNVKPDLSPGVYSTTLTYICTGRF